MGWYCEYVHRIHCTQQRGGDNGRKDGCRQFISNNTTGKIRCHLFPDVLHYLVSSSYPQQRRSVNQRHASRLHSRSSVSVIRRFRYRNDTLLARWPISAQAKRSSVVLDYGRSAKGKTPSASEGRNSVMDGFPSTKRMNQ